MHVRNYAVELSHIYKCHQYHILTLITKELRRIAHIILDF